jgi:hypothetical protein
MDKLYKNLYFIDVLVTILDSYSENSEFESKSLN